MGRQITYSNIDIMLLTIEQSFYKQFIALTHTQNHSMGPYFITAVIGIRESKKLISLAREVVSKPLLSRP